VAEVLSLRIAGRPPVALRYVRRGRSLFVAATGGERGWASTVASAGGAVVEVEGARGPCSVSPVDDPDEQASVRRALQAKYDATLGGRYFDGPLRILRLETGARSTPPGDLERLRGEFDSVAPTYEQRVDASQRQRYLKAQTIDWLVRELAAEDPLLEIGPGAGVETLPLLAAGHTVVALDISPVMLGELRARAKERGWGARLSTVTAPLRDLDRALTPYADATFGAAYSTFGAFNLERELGSVGPALERVLRPGGRLLFTSLSRPGVVPVAWEIAAGHVRRAAARFGRTMPEGGLRYALDVYPRNPAFWDRTLGPGFERTETRPASVLAPPFDSDRLGDFLGPNGVHRAARVDAVLRRHGWLSPFAEWTCLEYRRTGAGTPSRSPSGPPRAEAR